MSHVTPGPVDPERRGDTTQVGGASRSDTPVLVVSHVTKWYPGTLALDDVSMTIGPGTVHGLVGGNGSGKSTLVKIVCGVERGEPGGTITLGDETIDAAATSPGHSHARGVRVVHQDLGVFPSMTIAENLFLGTGFERTPWGQVRWPAVRRRAEELIDRFGIPGRAGTHLGQLSRGAQTLVAIARALQDDAGAAGSLLVLDEPTASLPRHEAEALLTSVRGLADRGQAIIYISHRLDEIVSTTDEFTALRDGRVAHSGPTAGVTASRLVEIVAGRTLARATPRSAVESGEAVQDRPVVLDVRDLAVGPVRSATFQLHAGEVLGIAGLLGSGRSEVLHAIFGDLVPTSGTVQVDGTLLRPGSVRAAMDAGLALIPEDRLRSALFVKQSVAENLTSARIGEYASGGAYRYGRLRRDAEDAVRRFGVKVSTARDPVMSLSGGNQQKVVVGRWMLRNPRVLLLDEPTQGVDVAARSDIYRDIDRGVANGAGVLVASSDLEELQQVCHRVIVLRDGQIHEELTGQAITVGAMTELSYSAGLADTATDPSEQEST